MFICIVFKFISFICTYKTLNLIWYRSYNKVWLKCKNVCIYDSELEILMYFRTGNIIQIKKKKYNFKLKNAHISPIIHVKPK